MRFLKNLLSFLLILIVVLIATAFALPSTSHVERSITINRHVSQVFAVLDGYRRFNEWSPWAAKDPHAKYTISGPVSGVGAKQSWVGDPKTVGSGSQEIVAAEADRSVSTALAFGDDMRARARFVLAPESDTRTKVTWTFDADAPLAFDAHLAWNAVGRYMGLMMDKMIGPDYEQGLTKLKALLEGMPPADIGGVQGEEVERAAQKIYFIAGLSATDSESARSARAEADAKLDAFLRANGIASSGAPLTITDSYEPGLWKFEAAVPVERNDVPGDGTIQSGATDAGKALQFIHAGPYERIGDTVSKAYAWLAVQGYKPNGRLVSEYLNDPGTTPAEQLKTRIAIPVQ